jgi:predicted ribonuclease YlaK
MSFCMTQTRFCALKTMNIVLPIAVIEELDRFKKQPEFSFINSAIFNWLNCFLTIISSLNYSQNRTHVYLTLARKRINP